MGTKYLKRTLCVGLGVAAAATAASPAMAASPFVRDTSICPVDKVAVGGGSQVVGEGTADFKTSLQESTPGTIGGGAQSLWLTALRNNDIKQHKIGLFAVCAKLPSGYQVVRKDTVVPAAGFLRTTADCPVGKVVLAGGAAVVGAGTGDFQTRLQESAPGTIGGGAQSVWLAAVRNASTVSRTVGVFAVCGYRPAGYQVVRKDSNVAASGGFLRTTADCPAGKVVLGGGASVIGAGTANFKTSMQESAPGTVGSSVSVHLAAVRNNGTVARTIGVHAVCASPLGAYQVVRKDVLAG